MPTLKKFSILGATGNLEGVTLLPDGVPRAIAVVAHPLPTMEGTMENKVVTTLAKTFAVYIGVNIGVTILGSQYWGQACIVVLFAVK